MNKRDYIKKAEQFIQKGPYKEIKYDYTSKFQAQTKKLIKKQHI